MRVSAGIAMFEAYTGIQSYNTYGGHPTLSLLGMLMEEFLSDRSHGVVRFEAVACFRTNRPPRKTLEESFARFHDGLGRLPTTRWDSKKRGLSVRYLSQLGLAEEVVEVRVVSPVLLARALEEIVGVLVSLRPKLRKRPGLDCEALIVGLQGLRPHVQKNAEDLEAFAKDHRAKREAARARLRWDEQLGIDWDSFHPRAREVLDDPFFWSQTDDWAPHGNDTGADLLDFFARWRRSHRDQSSQRFLDDIFSKWGMAKAIDRARNSEPDQLAWGDEIAVTVLMEATVALAFAEIKIDGGCRYDLAAEARTLLARHVAPSFRRQFGWPAPSGERLAASSLLLAKLHEFLPPEEGP